MNDVIVGIDLGTTNSEIAVWQNNRVRIIEGDSGPVLPSCVGIDNDGNIIIGEPARNQYIAYPERTVKSVKRLMGSGTNVTMNGMEFSPQEISAMIIGELKRMAERELGQSIEKAVITVPAFFSDVQRQATREAGEIAGLQVVKMINEPTAATLAYETGTEETRKVLVYDLGGGTFDVSVVNMEAGVIEVMASHGNNALGGDDFDERISGFITDYLMEEHGITEIPQNAVSRIMRAAEDAKKALSAQPFATIREEYLLKKDGAPFNLELELSREDYHTMIQPLVDETIDAVHFVLKDAGMVASDIDEILLVGGSTRTVLVQNRLEELFSMQPRSEVNPDLCVAAGAAIQAAMISGDRVHAVLVDVTPYTFGTSAIGEIDGMPTTDMFVPIIRRNTPIPVTKSEVFYTAVPNQQAVEVKVCQGENRNALENVEVGRFRVEGLKKGPAGQEIIARFALDANGMLEVTAIEKATGLEKHITIENVLSGSGDDNITQAKERVQKLFGEGQEPQAGESASVSRSDRQADALVEKARAMLDSAGDDDREDLVDMIDAVTTALESGDEAALAAAVEELSDLIFYLES